MEPPSNLRDPAAPLRKVAGHFFRSVLADQVERVLAPPGPTSAGRYHRLGQAAFFMSPTVEWATIAVSGYIREDGRARVAVPLLVGEAFVVDQRDEHACNFFGIDRDQSSMSWRPLLAAAAEPASWRNADAARMPVPTVLSTDHAISPEAGT